MGSSQPRATSVRLFRGVLRWKPLVGSPSRHLTHSSQPGDPAGRSMTVGVLRAPRATIIGQFPSCTRMRDRKLSFKRSHAYARLVTLWVFMVVQVTLFLPSHICFRFEVYSTGASCMMTIWSVQGYLACVSLTCRLLYNLLWGHSGGSASRPTFPAEPHSA